MTSTRISNDEARIRDSLFKSTFAGRYNIDVPGNDGNYPSYISDPYIRIQGWGANLMTNAIDLESQLFGINHRLTKGCQKVSKIRNTQSIQYPECNNLTTLQPRAAMPAWTVKDTQSFIDPSILYLNPQENTALCFQNNISTRIMEKDFF